MYPSVKFESRGVAMKERGMIFSTEMVPRLLDGSKTVTRRLIDPQPVTSDGMIARQVPIWLYPHEFVEYCPYGQVGDGFYIRELLRLRPQGWIYAADGMPVLVAAEDELAMVTWAHHKELDYCPSIHMPKFAARPQRYEYISIRPERLQEITWEDCIAEGIPRYTAARGCLSDNPPDPRWAYIDLWDTLHPKHPFGTNPWVWRLEFKEVPSP